jgi:hypothetical protein
MVSVSSSQRPNVASIQTSDPLLKDASIPGVIQEFVKTLKKSGIPEGKLSKLSKDGALEEYIHGVD